MHQIIILLLESLGFTINTLKLHVQQVVVVTFDFKGRDFIYQEFMSAEQSRNCSALLVHHLLISLPLLILRANLQSSPEHCMNCCTENFELKVCFFVSFFNSNRIEL